VVEGTKLGGFDIVGAMLGAIDNVGALDGSMLTVGTELGTELDVCLFVLPLSDSVEVRTLSTKNAGIQFRNRSQCGRYLALFSPVTPPNCSAQYCTSIAVKFHSC
jgi:hypothetical protein